MENMTSLSKFALKIALIPLTLCALAGCWQEVVTGHPEDKIRPLNDTDVERLEEALESLGRPEAALRIVLQNASSPQTPAKTTALANTLLPSVCDLSSQSTDNKWGPADLRLSAVGAGCPVIAEISTATTEAGLQTTLRMTYARRIPEAQHLVDAREVISFSAIGNRLRRQIVNVPVPSVQTEDSIRGRGRLQNGDVIEVNVSQRTQAVFGKATHEYRHRQLTLTVKTRSFFLESEDKSEGGNFYRLNGKDIPAAVFEDYFSRLGFIGSLSPSTDAG